MTWSASAVHRAFVTDMAGNTAAFDLSGSGVDTFKVAAYNNSITPDKDATAANSAYNAGQWANTNEQTDSTRWPAGGVTLGSPAISNPSSGRIMWDATDTASGSGCSITMYGVLHYDDTLASPVADQGVCYNYLGGVQQVTNGVLTLVYDADGIFYATV